MNQKITESDYKLAEENGISRGLVDLRMRMKWNKMDALQVPHNARKPFKQVWEEWQPIAKKNGVNYKMFYARVRRQRWTPYRAATEKPNILKPKYEFTAEEFELMEKAGIDKRLATMRIDRLKWSRKKAVSRPRVTHAERIAKQRKAAERKWKIPKQGGNHNESVTK